MILSNIRNCQEMSQKLNQMSNNTMELYLSIDFLRNEQRIQSTFSIRINGRGGGIIVSR